MILECFGALFGAFLVSLAGYLLVLGAKNRLKYQFFAKNAPGLKVVENPSLFGGHTNQIINVRHNLFTIEDVLREYGPTVGFFLDTRPAVLTIDLDFIKTFIVDEQDHINRTKLTIPLEELVEDCLMCAGDEQWLRLRKAVAPAFSAHKIKSSGVQSDISRTIGKFVDLVERRLDEAKEKRQEDFIEADAEDICHRYALALVFANFYKQDDVIDFYSEKDHYVNLIKRSSQKMVGFFMRACTAFPFIQPLVNWLVLNFDDEGVMRNTVMNYIELQTKLNIEAATRISMKNGTELEQGGSGSGKIGSKFKRNMIDNITDQYCEGKLTKREYFHSTYFLFFAANKTTADALSRCLYNLAHNQEAQEKLRASIMTSGLDSEYLSWVVHETLRMHPPAPIGCSRTIKRDIRTKHGLVPAGTFVITPVYTISRLKEYWGEDADEFRPERWANAKNFHPVQYLAFGGGRRACPGKELALMEIKMLVDVLMRRYKFEKSNIHTIDNSKLLSSPLYFTLVFDTPTYLRISRLK